MSDVGTYDDDEAFADGDPDWDTESAEKVGAAVDRVSEIEDPGERYLASAGLLTELYGEDLVIP